MNPHHTSSQIPASASAVQQVNPVINQQMLNGNVGGIFPNNMAVAGFMNNFPSQPFPLQNPTGQIPNPNIIGGFTPHPNFNQFAVNQFNPTQGQFFAQTSMNLTAYQQRPCVGLSGEQVLVQNTIQNICQLLQLQNSSYTQCPTATGNLPMFQNQIVNPQNPGFPATQQFGMYSANAPMQHANHGPRQQLQGNPCLPVASGLMQTQQPQNIHATLTNFRGNQINVPNSVNGGRAESQHKNIAGHKTYDAAYKKSKSRKRVEEKFGVYKGNDRKDGDNNLAVGIASQSSTSFEKKGPSLNYTEQEIKEWREARKKNYPTNGTVLKKHKTEQALSDVTNQDAMLRRQQLKDILAKQAELGCEVAEIPESYLYGPDKQNLRQKKHERQQYKRGKFHSKRGTSFQDFERNTKRARPRGQDSFKANCQTKPNEREPSLLQKLLRQDIKRDKTHLLQVLRFITANSFFTGDSLRFLSVVVRETNVDVPCQETTCSLLQVEEEEEEIID